MCQRGLLEVSPLAVLESMYVLGTWYSKVVERLGSSGPSSQDQIPKSVLTLFSDPRIKPAPQIAGVQASMSNIDDVLCDALYDFQREGIELAISRNGRIILADDMGLGKSLQALAIASHYRLEWPLLVITPASMVASWQEVRPGLCTDRVGAANQTLGPLHSS